jgi:hypothetical protein
MGEPIKESIQQRGRGEKPITADTFLLLAVAGNLLPKWWSKSRDIALRDFWKKVDTLAGAMYVMESKISTIPVHIEARDKTIAAHVKQAEQSTEALVNGAEFGEGWGRLIEPSVEDLLTQDNGMFWEIIGMGKPDEPIEGMPLTISRLDAARCQRTGSPEFPVIYRDEDGKLYKLHFTRVAFMSQMPSPNISMRGVGFCAVSRCSNIAQCFYDLLTYKQEKLGSRPKMALGITKGGLAPEDVNAALAVADENMDNQNLSRYSKIALIGSRDIPDAAIDIVDMSSMPDGFDEEKSTTLTMAAIALAFGMDARELWPAMSSGATKAEALVQHLKQRGKGPGHILESLTRMLESKYLPPHLMAVFDFQDDEEDREIGEIKDKRADTTKKHLDAGITDMRTAREQALSSGDLEKAQFIKLELADGRLEDGDNVLTLFYDPDYTEGSDPLLEMGSPNPTDIKLNNSDVMMQAIANKRLELMKMQAITTNYREKAKVDNAMAALEYLEKLYNKPQVPEQLNPFAGVNADPNANPDTTTPDQKPADLTPNTATDMNTDGETGIANAMKSVWKRIMK